jgi:hypothetical protein
MQGAFGCSLAPQLRLDGLRSHQTQRACAVFRPIRLLRWWPVVWSEPDVCSGSTRNNQSRRDF